MRGEQAGPLLNPVLRGGRLQGRAMSAQAVYDLCLKLARLAATGAFAPHDCRRSWIGELLEITDLSTARAVRRPRTGDSAAGYHRRPRPTAGRRAARLHVPYVAPRAA